MMLTGMAPLLVSCQKTIDDDDYTASRLVVEGWIDSGGHPTVILTRSFSPMNPDDTKPEDLVVRWAKVTISDGESTATMIGRIDNDVTPPFVYTTADMVGRPGMRYTVTAEYDGEQVSAECTMPEPTAIGRIDVLPVAASDTLREVTLTFVPDGNRYYHLVVYDPTVSERFLPCFMGTYCAEPGMSKEVTLTVCRPNIDTDGDAYTPYFSVGHDIGVALTTVTPEVWEFWHQYDDVTAFGGNIFLAGNVPLGGNVAGGYGVWSARGYDYRKVVLE